LRTNQHFEKLSEIEDLSLKVIDFGSATFDNEYHTKIINTRQYRAPEVIIGSTWDKPSDNWGIACIILELYTGELYFSTHES
jgi:serine/threonine protein kinase